MALASLLIGVLFGSAITSSGSSRSAAQLAARLVMPVLPTPAASSSSTGGDGPSWTAADPVAVAACIDQVLPNLPLAPAKHCASASHHFDAGTGNWNEGIRFDPLRAPGESVLAITAILYIGGNTNAGDVAGLQRLLPGRRVLVLEPVPDFYAQLKRLDSPDVTVYNLGLANSTRDVELPKAALKGQSTVVMNATAGGAAADTETLHLVSPADFLVRAGLDPSKDQALLHANCEGCEYEMFESLLDGGGVGMLPVIQVSFHFVPEVPLRLTRYCSIRARLSKTHKPVVDMPFGWERWLRSDLLR